MRGLLTNVRTWKIESDYYVIDKDLIAKSFMQTGMVTY
jgi:hypothetical protein